METAGNHVYSARHRVKPGQHLAAARPGRPRVLEDPRLWFDSRVVVQRPHRDHDHARPRGGTRYSATTFAAERIREAQGLGHLELAHQRLASVPGERSGDEQIRRMACPGRLAAPRTVAVKGALRLASYGVADATAQAATGKDLGVHGKGPLKRLSDYFTGKRLTRKFAAAARPDTIDGPVGACDASSQ